jgi:hypothetical protein
MSSRRGFLIGVLSAATWGCIGSVNPVIPDSAASFEPQLLGTWSDSASRERAVISQTGPRSYGIQYTDDQGQTLSLVGLLGRNRERFILDVQPTAEAIGPYKDLVVRLHIPVILNSIGPRIQVAILEPDSLDQYLRTHPRAIAHGRTHAGAQVGGSREAVVLTADSPELWQFFATYLQRPGALSAPSTWIRRSP